MAGNSVRYKRNGKWSIGEIVTLVSEIPGMYSVYKIKDSKSGSIFSINSRDIEFGDS